MTDTAHAQATFKIFEIERTFEASEIAPKIAFAKSGKQESNGVAIRASCRHGRAPESIPDL